MTPLFLTFILVLARSGALVVSAPILSSNSVPKQVRVVLAGVLALTAVLAGVPQVAPDVTLGSLALLGLRETALGLIAGLSARVALDAAFAAGHLAGLTMGFNFGSVVDPATGAQSTALSMFTALTALAFAVVFGLHRELIVWLYKSLWAIPPGAPFDWASMVGAGISQALHAVSLAVKLAFPIMLAVTLSHVVLGLSGRFASQLNLGSLGFSVAIMIGSFAVYAVIPPAAEMVANMAITSVRVGAAL